MSSTFGVSCMCAWATVILCDYSENLLENAKGDWTTSELWKEPG